MFPPNLKAVVFDLDGTLYDLKRMRTAMAFALLRELVWRPNQLLRVTSTLGHYRKALEELRSRPRCADLAEAQLELTIQRCGQPGSAVRECVQRWFVERPQVVLRRLADPRVAETLAALRQANFKLAVLSDYPADGKLEALGLRSYFDVVASAGETGLLKPDPTGLLQVVRQLNVEPGEALYVGDRFEVDGITARQAGVRCAILGAKREDCIPLASIPQLRDLLVR